MTLAVYPGTFDPLTVGHVNLIERASHLFDELIVAVALSDHKKTLFSFAERLSLVQQSFQHTPQIRVLPLEGLLVDFVAQHQAHVIVRGLRTAADFEYEFQLAGMNRKLSSQIETVFMTPSEETLFISATLVRELIRFKGDVSAFCPTCSSNVFKK